MPDKKNYVVTYTTVIRAESLENAMEAAELVFIEEPLLVKQVYQDIEGIQFCYLDAEEIILANS